MWYTNIVYSRRKVREKFRRTEEIPALGIKYDRSRKQSPRRSGRGTDKEVGVAFSWRHVGRMISRRDRKGDAMLKNKTAVVTGGTRGIGFAIVKRYLDNGANVAIAGSRQETVDKALAGLTEYEGHVMGIWPNLCDPEEVAESFASVKERFGSLDILANNAGISSRTSLYDYTLEEFTKIVDINLKAVFVCSQAAARIMKEQGGGVIINTSSMVSQYGQPSGCGYPATKFAVDGLTKSLARELAKDKIRVNAVAPGVTKTDMVAALPKEMVDRISAGIPLGRPGEPEDIANAYLYLASDLAAYVTGAVVRVDGAAMT